MHSQLSSKALVLFNLGGPDGAASVRPFLMNLFNDRAIIKLPQPIRWIIAQVISRKRAPIAKTIYEKLGGSSPLLTETQKQADALRAQLGRNWEVFVCMRYWHPFSSETVKAVKEYNPDQIILLPLYPQYSTTTTGSAIADWVASAKKLNLQRPTKVIRCYPVAEGVIKAHCHLLQEVLTESSIPVQNLRVLFSAHGLPTKVIAGGDPYQWQVEKTASEIVNNLGVKNLDWRVCYQSRVGPLQWIGPSTEEEIARAGIEGKSLVVVPVAFVSEHSETLVELDIEYGELAKSSGVPEYRRVPALGITSEFVSALAELAQRLSAGQKDQRTLCPQHFKQCGCRTLR